MNDQSGRDVVGTKVVPPMLPGSLVVRKRLDEVLDAAVEERQPLVLLSAPAGSGKTTLLAEWLSRRSEGLAWLQVESSDADPARFWSYLVAAIGRVHPDVEEAIRPLIATVGGDELVVVSALVNELALLPEPLVVVIDDYHLIDNERVHRGLERLVELAPPAVTIVVATRVDPPFRLGRFRVRNQLTEIRAGDLRFAPDEAGSLLGAEASGLSDALVGELCERTEGWAAGLVLAGLSLVSAESAEVFIHRFKGDDQFIVDYLSDELLAAVSEDDRRRLLETSVLERLTGSLVDAVTGSEDGAEWLRRTAVTNQLLICLDHTGTWFRYHHLLRDLLRLEAERTLGQRMSDLHLAAAAWLHHDGDMHQAVEQYLAGEDLATAADLIADHATELLNGGQLQTVVGQLDRLGEVADGHVGALVVRGWIALVTGRLAEAQRLSERARLLDVDRTDEGLIAALGIMTNIARGDVASALAAADATVEPSEATQAMTLGAVRVWAGRFAEARPFLELADEMAASEPHDFVAAVNPIFIAVAEIESGNPGAAIRQAERAIDLAANRSMSEAPQMALAHSIAARTSPEPATGATEARRGVELARRSPEYIMLAYALACAGDVLCGNGDPEGMELLVEARSVIDRCPDPGVAGVYLAQVEARHGALVVVPRSPELVDELTDREFAVLRLLPSELSQRDIASELYVALNTVKTHCKAIYRKLGVSDRKAAVQAARDLHLL